MKFCKAWVSEKRHGEQALRALMGLVFVLAVVGAVACSRRADVGFDIVAVPSAAYLTLPLDAGSQVADGGSAREGGAVVAGASVKCEKAPEDDFEPSEEISVCPSENDQGWPLEPKVTTRHREDREEDVCCFKRPSQRRMPDEE